MLLQLENVINGEDMTAEAALAKLSFAMANYAIEDLRSLFAQNLRGEVTFEGQYVEDGRWD